MNSNTMVPGEKKSHMSAANALDEASGMQGDTGADLKNSLFQLPIRHRSMEAAAAPLKDIEDADISQYEGDVSQQPRRLLYPAERAFECSPEMNFLQHKEQFLLSDMAFERLACGDYELLEAYLDAGAPIEHENRDGLTLLVVAIKDSNVAMTELLLRKGADVQHRAEGKPPLFHAVQSQEHGPKLIRLLLDYGANINTICGTQRLNALHWAAAAGMLDAADYLMSRGIYIEATCAKAHTALHVAAGTGHLTVARLLLAKGAELFKRGGLGGNALTFAACQGHLDIVKTCLENGMFVDDCDEKGLTALMSACELGHTHVVSYLIEKGADPNRVDTRLSSPAHEAAAKGHVDILQVLIAANASLDLRNAEAEDILEVAISSGHTNAVRLILQTLGGPAYPLESVSLEIASARKLGTMRALVKTASLMYAHIEPTHGSLQERGWVKWVLDVGGDLVRQKAMSNMILVAVSEADVGLVEALLYNGADPNEFSLSTAVVNRNLDIVQLLLDHGAGPAVSARCIKHPDGLPANIILDALLNMRNYKNTCLAILKLLLDTRRFNILEGPSSNRTPFWRVLETRDWGQETRDQVAFMMLESVSDFNYACNGDGGTLMHHVVRHGRDDMVDLLLEKGANINAQDNKGRTPFILACEYQPGMVSSLLRKCADNGLYFEDGRGPLHAAATAGSVEALRLLWNNPALVTSPDLESRDGWTPLSCALAADHEEAALFLVECGANLRHTVTVTGQTMLHLAAAFGHERVFRRIMESDNVDVNAQDKIKISTPLLLACAGTRYRTGSSQIVRALIAAGADIEAAGGHLDRPLHVAVMTRNTAIAELLIECGASITATGSKGRTPLHLTAECHNPRIMQLLLKKGAATEVTDDMNWTPLHLCIEPLAAQILIDHGAYVDHTDRNGLTPLHQAVAYDDVELFTTLHENSASTAIRAESNGLNVIDMIEDKMDFRLRAEFMAVVKRAPLRCGNLQPEHRESRE